MTFARIIDYETTGTPEDDSPEILELGRIDVALDQEPFLDNPWHTLVKPRGPIPPETKAVHHITEADVVNAPALRDVWDEFTVGLKSLKALVAHNADFEKFFWDGDGLPWIDTYKVALVVYPDAPKHSNQALRYWLELPAERDRANPPHRALPDAYVTGLLLIHLLQHKTLEEMITISSYPPLLRRITFGTKAKGQTYEEAPLDYLEWLRDKSEMGEDVKFSARYWIQKRTKA